MKEGIERYLWSMFFIAVPFMIIGIGISIMMWEFHIETLRGLFGIYFIFSNILGILYGITGD